MGVAASDSREMTEARILLGRTATSSLSRTGTRQMREDGKLRMLLERYGFQTLEPGDISFRDQIDIFRGASAVVAPHGAALTTILFAPDECRVLELLAGRGGGNQYGVLASALGQDYTALRDRECAPTFAARGRWRPWPKEH